MKIREKLYEALIKKYESQMSETEATLMVCMENPVGIGEHPQHLGEMDNLIEQISNANDKLKTLKEFYKYNYGN